MSYYNYEMALIKYRYSPTPIRHPHNFTIHAIPDFFIGIICGPIWGSFPARDHLWSNLWIIAVRDHLRSWDHLPTRTIPHFLIGIICGPIWGSFPVGDHLRFNLEIICGPGSFANPYRLLRTPEFISELAFQEDH